MHIVIIGAGAVGSYLAERLSHEGQDVVVVESDPLRAAELQREIDALVVNANGVSPTALENAGLAKTDLLIAVTSSDAVNVLAAHAGHRLNVPKTIARVEDPMLVTEAEALGVDLLIDPGITVANELIGLLKQGVVSELIEFAGGRLDLIGGFIRPEAPVAGLSLAELRALVTGWTWVVVAVIRGGKTIIARGSTRLRAGDHVLIMAETQQADQAFQLLGWSHERPDKIVVLGATRTAQLTAAAAVKEGIDTVLIDNDVERVSEIAERLPKVICVWGDPTDPRLMRAEGAETADAILALTGWDEVNLLGCLVGKAIGIPNAIARFHRFDLVDILPGVGIDAGVSSRLSAANEILRFVRKGNVHSVATFQDSDAEAIEIEITDTSPVANMTLAELHPSHDMIIGGVIRGEEAFVPRGKTKIQVGDRLIVITSPDGLSAVEAMARS